MQFEMSDDKVYVDVRHKNEVVSFSMTYFKKGKNNADVRSAPMPFSEFNKWLNTQPAKWHDEKFLLMKEAKDIIENTPDIELCLRKLSKVYKDIYADVDLKKVEQWILTPASGISIPKKIREADDSDDFIGKTREKTYTYQDYLDLISYSLMLRFAAPVWGDTYQALTKRFGKDAKEVYALEVLAGTGIDNCKAEQRLREYTMHAQASADKDSAIISALSEDDFHEYIYSVIVIKKVVLGDISGVEEKSRYSLIIEIYNYLGSKVKSSKNYGPDTAGIQMKKKPNDILGSENNSQSVHDIGFSRSRFTQDDKVFQNKALTDLPMLVHSLCPDLPEVLLSQSMANLEDFYNIQNTGAAVTPIQEIQLSLISWVINPSVSFVALDEITYRDIVQVVGVVRAILWYWGFYEFAAIVSGIAYSANEEIQIGSSIKLSMDTQLQDELNRVFCLGAQTRAENRNMTPQGTVELIDKGIGQYTWQVTLPKEWLNTPNTGIVTRRNRLIVNANIKNRIAQLMLFIANITSNETDVDLDDFEIL